MPTKKEYPKRERVRALLTRDQCEEHETPLGGHAWTVKDPDHPKFGKFVCGAMLRNPRIENEVCEVAPLKNKTKCRMHGGHSDGSGMTTHGRYSKSLKRWRKAYHDALERDDMMDLRPTLAMQDVLIDTLIARLEGLDTHDYRDRIKSLCRKFDAAMRSGDPDKVADARSNVWPTLLALADTGATEDKAQRELVAALERRSAHTARAIEVHAKAGNTINATEMVSIMGGMVDLLEQRLPSDLAADMARQFHRYLMGRGLSPPERLSLQ